MNKTAKIYVAGHKGLVGSAIVRELDRCGFTNLLLRTSSELDLRDQTAVRGFFQAEKPEYVFLAAAKVGGIVANSSYPAEFIYDNLMIQANVIHNAWLSGVKRLLFLGSTCIYPKMAPQPIREEYLLTGPLEPTNEPYAIAKIAGIKMCESYNRQYGAQFVAAMPTNVYGPNDNFDLETSHVLPALIRKFHEAKVAEEESVTVWGTGAPLREFVHADDVADASVFLLSLAEDRYHELAADPFPFVNVGSGEEVSIRELALLVRDVVGFEGDVVFDTSRPDGTPRKLSDLSKIGALGWRRKVALAEGIKGALEWFVRHAAC